MRQAVDGVAPTVHESAYVHPEATLIGDVTLEAETSVWPGVVLRGDEASIVLREGTNVQDNAVCHERVEIGPYATVGHSAIVHNCTVGERALVGMNAVVLDGSTVGDGAVVAAGSVVTGGTEIAPNAMVAGTPASVIKEDVGDAGWGAAADRYVDRKETYRETAERLDPDGPT
ncbi:MAG: gamma carbonic anhydrase family protein [Halobacteriales archaeon]|nr:gamma carbonic anhydrase family protein [Halobacteriales archaeon]